MGQKKPAFMQIFPKIFFENFFCQNSLYRPKIMRKIDCAHSRSVKMLPWPWFREIDVCIEAKIEKFWNFSLKIIFLGVISCGESIARIPKVWKGFSDPDSGKWVHVGFRFNTHSYFPESGSRKHFHALEMRAIDFSPRNYPKKSVFRRKSEKNFRVET